MSDGLSPLSALKNKLENSASAASLTVSLSAQECETLNAAIRNTIPFDFVTITLKYSKYGSVTIPDIARNAVTVTCLSEHAVSKWQGHLKEADFFIYSDDKCRHVVSDDYLRNAKYPRTLYIKTKQIDFSEFTEEDALDYAGISEIQIVRNDDPRFPQPASIPDTHDLLLHAVKDLNLKHKLYDPLEQCCEYTRREFISSVLVLAASIAEVKLACEEQVDGSLGKGPVDWMAHYANHRICITEGKKDNVAQGLNQNLAQLTAAGEGRGQKRSFCVDLPFYGIATTYREWIILRLEPSATRKKDSGAIRLRTFIIDDENDLKGGVQRIASRVAGLLQYQKSLLDQATGAVESAKKTKPDD